MIAAFSKQPQGRIEFIGIERHADLVLARILAIAVPLPDDGAKPAAGLFALAFAGEDAGSKKTIVADDNRLPAFERRGQWPAINRW